MRNILFVADTPFQLMMSIHLHNKVYKDDQVDLILCNHIANSQNFYARLNTLNIFHKVYWYDSLKYDKWKNRFDRESKKILRWKKLNELFQGNNHYDEMLTADGIDSIRYIYDYLFRKNRSLKLIFFEEGPVSVQCDQQGLFKRNEQPKITSYFHPMKIHHHFSEGYSVLGEQAASLYGIQFHKIPSFEEDYMAVYIDLLNKIWDYKGGIDITNKIIFFEESFFVDGHKDVHDMQLVEDLADTLGKKNILIKLHPRTIEDRFTKLGYRVLDCNNMPWELIALNNRNSNALVVSIASGAMIHPQIYWNVKQNALSPVLCHEYNFPRTDYINSFISFSEKRKLVDFPESRKALIDSLKQRI